jgi:hypothetical protein
VTHEGRCPAEVEWIETRLRSSDIDGRVLAVTLEEYGMSVEARYKRSDVPFKDFEEDGVLLDPESGEFYMLDNICHFIWTRIDENKTVTELAREITAEYDVSEKQAVDDLTTFLSELESKTLVVKV